MKTLAQYAAPRETPLAAAARALAEGATLAKLTDPTEGAREGLAASEAAEIAAEDPGLIEMVEPDRNYHLTQAEGASSVGTTSDAPGFYPETETEAERLAELRAPAGFEVRVTWTETTNAAGWSVHKPGGSRVWLDASFGMLLYERGEHVMTVGFAPCSSGVLVAQAQARRRRGNRWMYKLPGGRLGWVLETMRETFGAPLWLVTGASAVEASNAAYADPARRADPATDARVAAFYDALPTGWARSSEPAIRHGRLRFTRLDPPQLDR